MKDRLIRVAKILAYPAFYVFCLALFGYLKFPYGRLKDRVVAEFEKHAKPGQRLEIGKISSYWFTGIEVANVKLHLPPEEASPAGFPGAGDFGGGSAPAKETVLLIDEAHARVRFLPLLIGRVRLDFWASAFGGEIKGTVPVGTAKGEVEIEVEHVDLGKVDLGSMVPVPLRGTAKAKLVLDAPDGKINKANGSFDLTINDMVVSDGKTKIAGLLELPPAKLGDFVVTAEAKEGVLKITKLGSNGTDLDIVGDGKITLREPWSDALADLSMRFKFTDAYRGKSGTTKALLGDPGTTSRGLMETQVPKMSKARRTDGFYGWHVTGALKKLRFDPAATDTLTPTGGPPAPAAPRRPFRGAPATPPPAVEGATGPAPVVPPVPPPTPAGLPGGRRALGGLPPPPAVTAAPAEAPPPAREAPPPPPPPPPAEPAPEAPPPEQQPE